MTRHGWALVVAGVIVVLAMLTGWGWIDHLAKR